MSLKSSYSLISPFYDLVIGGASRRLREENLKALPPAGTLDVLISGIGTGLDLAHVPEGHRYLGLDLTAAMLRKAAGRTGRLNLRLVRGDSQTLPFADASFDWAVLHLILAVVPDAAACLRETARVLRPGGSILVLDKFLRPGKSAPVRRALNVIARRVATRLDVVFEPTLAQAPGLALVSDEPVLAGGWFRRIRLVKSDG